MAQKVVWRASAPSRSAAAASVDVPFVMALQTVRFLLVMVLGPMIAVAASRYLSARQG
jgi:uncharacterized membrane protein AbrB (regulator of aidB expression)